MGDLPGLLSLSLLCVWSAAPFSSSRIALAKPPRAGFPMEAVVYRGILFSAIEACQQPRGNLGRHSYAYVGRVLPVGVFSDLAKFIVARVASARC